MKKILSWIAAMSMSILLLSSCDLDIFHNNSEEAVYINYGTSFGECLGYCINQITVYETHIDFLAEGWEIGKDLPDITRESILDPVFWSTLENNINVSSVLELDEVIGCPDCADGGAEWIEIKTIDTTFKVTFEYRNEPSQLKEAVALLRTYISAFHVDEDEEVDFNNRTLIFQEGIIVQSNRGGETHQYVIGIPEGNDTTFYYDKYMDDTFKADSTRVIFHGTLQNDSTIITNFENRDPDNFKVRNMFSFGMGLLYD